MYRKALIVAFMIFTAIGIFVSFSPFVSSLNPNSEQKSQASHFDLTALENGQSAGLVVPHYEIQISKNSDGDITAFAIPIRDGEYQLPEFDWNRPLLACQSFIQVYGYQCLDTEDNEPVWFSYMKWDKSGKYIGEKKWENDVPDLLVAKYKISANQFIYLGL